MDQIGPNMAYGIIYREVSEVARFILFNSHIALMYFVNVQ